MGLLEAHGIRAGGGGATAAIPHLACERSAEQAWHERRCTTDNQGQPTVAITSIITSPQTDPSA